jgi:endonuclease/exonuclease/phosphatase family metal-dependent hydrolase
MLLGLMGCHMAPHGGSTDSIRVLVYNIHAGKDAARVENLERVAQIVKDSRASLVLLQEVDNGTRRSGKVNQLDRLKQLTGFDGVFGKTIDYDSGEYGIAILSRWPITSSRLVHLPVTITDSAALSKYEARGALVAKIRAPFGVVRVVDTHLDATSSDSNRVQQARTLLQVANAQRDSGFTLLGGDLNSEPASAVATALRASSWTDLMQTCGPPTAFSFPADKPVKRIDYLFGANDASCDKGSVPDTQASDHRPVLFDVVWHHR